MTELLRQVDPGAILDILADPTSNLLGAAVLLAVAVLLMLMLITVAGLVLLLLSSRGAERTPARVTAPVKTRAVRSVQERTRSTLMVAALVLLLVLLLARAGTTDTACKACHASGRATDFVSLQDYHLSVRCAGCHAPAVPDGQSVLALQVLGDVKAQYLGGAPGVSLSPASDNCLRCHENIDQPLAGARVRVSHGEFAFDQGFRCIDCHLSVGHEAKGRPGDRPRMTLCLRCHNGSTASSECSVCHLGDVAGASGVSIMDYPKITLGPVTTCRGCHSVEACNDCHGLELPHPAGFDRGEVHGPLAAFGRRSVCNRCHEREQCAVTCHNNGRDPSEFHPSGWNRAHAVSGSLETQRKCRRCHNKADFSCNMCHSGYPEP